MRQWRGYRTLILLLALLATFLSAVSMLTGPSAAGTFELLSMLSGGDADTAWLIMREVRLPRTLLALMEGFTLGLGGAALQGLLRNPLADPAVIGVSSGASLFAVLSLYTGVALAFPLALPLAAIAGALICVLLLLVLAGRGGMLTLILAGVAVAQLTTSLSYLALNLSPNPYASAEIVFWLMGSVTDRSLDHVWLAGPLMFTGWLMIMSTARSLDVLSLGEEAAGSLGVNLTRTRFIIVTGLAISCGAGTAVTGGIGFIGLLVPHLLRNFVGHSPGRLLLASGLCGGCLLLAADLAVRLIAVSGGELQLGVITALIGSPFFLWLVVRARVEHRS